MFKKIAASVLLSLMISFSIPALAANDQDTQSFAVVDMKKIMQTADVSKDVFEQLEKKRKEYKKQITKEEKVLRTAEQEILKKKDELSKEDFDKKRKKFEKKVIKGQKLVQSRKQLLDKAFNSSMQKIRQEAAKVVAAMAKEKKYAAVLTQDAVMMAIPALDMTESVIERMNKTVKKITINWSPSSEKSKKK